MSLREKTNTCSSPSVEGLALVIYLGYDTAGLPFSVLEDELHSEREVLICFS